MSSLSRSSLYQLTISRFRLFFREPEAVFWIFAFPILLSIGLSIAFRDRPADVLPVAGTTAEITQALNAEKGLKAVTLNKRQGSQALATGKILLLVVQQSGGVEFDYDNTNPDGRTARLMADRAVEKAAGQREPVGIRDELVHEVGSRYIDFVIPGLLGMSLMSSAIWALGFSIVEARQKNLLKRLIASPMPRWQYLASFVLSRLFLLVLEVAAFLGFSHFAFGVPLRGSLWQLGLLCVLVSLTFSAIGLLIASRARTMQAASGLMNLTMLPMWILSGVFFSSDRFPNVLQPFIRALPLTAAVDALRGNMLQGIPIAHLLIPVGILLTWLLIAFPLSLGIFRWR
ncbi:MAG: ABC transporter permease [Acidobacteriaceae bacterium]